MNKEAITTIFLDKLSKWEASQQNQTCGYLYEKTYVETMKQIEKEVLQEMITTGNAEGKKTSNLSRRSIHSPRTCIVQAG